jgi:hypothetical protein
MMLALPQAQSDGANQPWTATSEIVAKSFFLLIFSGILSQ